MTDANFKWSNVVEGHALFEHLELGFVAARAHLSGSAKTGKFPSATSRTLRHGVATKHSQGKTPACDLGISSATGRRSGAMSDGEIEPACCDVGVYEAWRKNIPWTYDWISSHFMEWGSLSAEWLGQRPLSQAAKLRLRSADDPAKLLAVSSLLGKMGAAEAETVMKGAYAQGLVMTTRTGVQLDCSNACLDGSRCCSFEPCGTSLEHASP